jgi:hypothetical protein
MVIIIMMTAVSMMTLSMKTLSMMTLSMVILSMIALRRKNTQNDSIHHYGRMTTFSITTLCKMMVIWRIMTHCTLTFLTKALSMTISD